MHLKKTFAAVVILFSCLAAIIISAEENPKTVEYRYQCRIELVNPFWHILFFLFSADNREFVWREKSGGDEAGFFREILLFNKRGQVIRFFCQNGRYEGNINFGTEEESDMLTAEQTKTWFEMQNFIRSARPEEKYEAVYQTPKNTFLIFIEAREKVLLKTSRGNLPAVYFEGRVIRGSEQFLDVKFWIVERGELKGQVIKCFFKKSFWPLVVVELD